jgi:hypothetical protein
MRARRHRSVTIPTILAGIGAAGIGSWRPAGKNGPRTCCGRRASSPITAPDRGLSRCRGAAAPVGGRTVHPVRAWPVRRCAADAAHEPAVHRPPGRAAAVSGGSAAARERSKKPCSAREINGYPRLSDAQLSAERQMQAAEFFRPGADAMPALADHRPTHLTRVRQTLDLSCHTDLQRLAADRDGTGLSVRGDGIPGEPDQHPLRRHRVLLRLRQLHRLVLLRHAARHGFTAAARAWTSSPAPRPWCWPVPCPGGPAVRRQPRPGRPGRRLRRKSSRSRPGRPFERPDGRVYHGALSLTPFWVTVVSPAAGRAARQRARGVEEPPDDYHDAHYRAR